MDWKKLYIKIFFTKLHVGPLFDLMLGIGNLSIEIGILMFDSRHVFGISQIIVSDSFFKGHIRYMG